MRNMQKRNRKLRNVLAVLCLFIAVNIYTTRVSATEVTNSPVPTATPITSTSPSPSEQPTSSPEASPTVSPSASPSVSPSPTPISESDSSWNNVVLDKTTVNQAVGTGFTLQLMNITADVNTYCVSFSSDNESIAKVDNNGNVTAVSVGTATINCKVLFSDQSYRTYNCIVTVTDPQFSSVDYVVGKGGSVPIGITGTTTTDYNVYISDPSIAAISSYNPLIVTGVKTGIVTIQITVDGRTMVTWIQVTQPKISSNLILLVKGKSYQLKVSGHSGRTPITYAISNSAYAKVNSTGKVTGSKYGSTVITVYVDNASYQATIAVGSTKTIGALKNAQKGLGKPYSQPKRMRAGYYDCSSLVWRSYKPYKIYFGLKKYAPTAAEQARYLVKKKKTVSYKYVSESKLQPGDVLYISTKRNGRYKNITHTGIYIGNNTIIHATPPRVTYTTYTKYKNSIVLIARPTK